MRAILLPLLALCLAGCPTPPPDHPITDAERALRLYGSLRGRARSMRAEAGVDHYGHEGRTHLRAMMLLVRPDHVRFDATTSFHATGAILTSDGRAFALLDLRDDRFLVGEPCGRNIARLLGVPLDAPDVATLLMGGSPIVAHRGAEVTWDAAGYYRVLLRGRDGVTQEIHLGLRDGDEHVDPASQRTRLLESTVRTNGRLAWRATFDDYRIVSGIAMPYRVRFEEPRSETDVLLRFDSIELNPEIPDEAFTQRPPGGVRIEQVSCDE